MLLQQENAKLYFFVKQAGQGGLRGGHQQDREACLLKRTAESNQATSGNIEMVSREIAIAEAPEKPPTTLSGSHPTATVRDCD